MTHPELERESSNYILAALPKEIFAEIEPELERVEFQRGKVVHAVGAPLTHVYFVDRGLVSLVKTMRDGQTVEIGAVGIEGAAGFDALFGASTAILESVVQIPATARRIGAEVLRRKIGNTEALRALMQRYMHFVIAGLAQTAACNRLHSLEERCCRWLLIAEDCALSNTFPLTHEFLAMMLGVRRSGVSIAAGMLQRAGYIRYTRGKITITDRPGLEANACECYGVIRTQLEKVFALEPS